MTKADSRILQRCTGLAILVVAALVLMPAVAQAQTHILTVGKECVSPKVACGTDADCSDGVFCNGTEQCATEETPGLNITDCTITIINPGTHVDNILITEACDVITNPPGVQDCDILISFSDSADPGCAVNTNLGGGTTCLLEPGETVQFHTAQTIPPGAPLGSLPDQGTLTIIDTCSGGAQGCSSVANDLQIPAATDIVEGCSAGTPPCVDDDGVFCNGIEGCDEVNDVCLEPTAPCQTDIFFCSPTICDEEVNDCVAGPQDEFCEDNNACTDDICDEDADACVNNPTTVALSCDPNCEECDISTGQCVDLVPQPAECVPGGEEICRTPGFWGTHGGVEKEGHSTDITLAVLNAYCGTLEICGNPVSNTDECSVESALEAICVSPKGDSCLQLGRQLTAAALNCAITKSTNSETGACEFPDCVETPGGVGAACEGLSVGAVFEACNTACGVEPCELTADVDLDNDVNTPAVTVNCIGALDCFNNGFTIDPATGECDDTLPTGCHDRPLCGDFQPPGSAGSPKECADSRKNCVTIFGATDQCDDACVP